MKKTLNSEECSKKRNKILGKVADLLHRVKKMQLLSTKAEELLQAYKHIPLHLLSGKVGQKFTDEQKQFAISLHYYSPAAYQYVRRRFNLLPCPRTIRSWLARYEASPGLNQQSFDTIALQNESQSSSAYRLCAVHIDEVEVKKHVENDRTTGSLYGFTDIGSGTLHSVAECIVHGCANLWAQWPQWSLSLTLIGRVITGQGWA